jgi:hypothetical protein
MGGGSSGVFGGIGCIAEGNMGLVVLIHNGNTGIILRSQ